MLARLVLFIFETTFYETYLLVENNEIYIQKLKKYNQIKLIRIILREKFSFINISHKH